tara:strand:+ start:1108 stop:1956 length:849 start_codon:yes stop_codon:yes gene_type:complete
MDKLNRTYSSFSNDRQVNRAKQTRRDDDTIKTQACTIYDHDFAILSYIRDIAKPKVSENDANIDVPVMFANGEKWSQIQSNGFMRDAKGKTMTPLIMIRRNSITERDTLKKLDVNMNPDGNSLVLQSKYTNRNRYDRFSATSNSKPNKEYYVTSIPEFVDISYELFFWTSLQEQLNQLIEQLMPLGGFAWGTTWKFACYINDYSMELSNDAGEDRMVRATLPVTMKGTILSQSELYKSNMQKQFGIKQVKLSETQIMAPPSEDGGGIGTNGNFQPFYRRFDQ